jgi:hypothetical protein
VRDLRNIPAQLRIWLENFIERTNPDLGNWPPCPYARQARINNRIAFVGADAHQISDSVGKYEYLLQNHDVVVMYFDHTTISSDYLQQQVHEINRKIMPEDLVILEDHPDATETINGVTMNFGMCGLVILQRLSDLNRASDQLRSKGYYNHWAESDLADVVTWRYKSDPRTDGNP